MNKKESQTIVVFSAVGVAFVWLNIFFIRGSEPWIWVSVVVAGTALIGAVAILVKSRRRQPAEYWQKPSSHTTGDATPPADGVGT